MPTRAGIIQKATAEGRKAWTNYLEAQQRYLYGIYRSMADDLSMALIRAEKEGHITPYKARQVRQKIAAMTGLPKMKLGAVVGRLPPGLYKQLQHSISKGMAQSVDYGLKNSILAMYAGDVPASKLKIGTSFIGKDGQVRRFDAAQQTFASSTWNKVSRHTVNAVKQWKPGGVAFSERVWEITYQTQKQLLGALEQGVVQGHSAGRISRAIRQHLALPDTFRGEVLKDFHPGVGIYKSAYKNAMRLARTELSRAYTEGTVRYAMAKSWLDGWIWRLGNVDACEICAANAGKFFAKPNPPGIPAHPHCLCHAELHIQGDPKA